MSDLTERNPAFRAWVETFPDEYWAKKDLSACRLGWDAATQRCSDIAKKQSIQGKTYSEFEDGYDAAIENVVKALEKQE